VQENARLEALRRSADPVLVAAIEEVIEKGKDSDLCRIDPIQFAKARGLNEEATLDAFIRASRLGIFEMSWNLLCPGCGGVLTATTDLKEIQDNYNCALCAVGYEPTLDEMVEVSFSVSPAIRRIAHHDPDSVPVLDYYRFLHFSNTMVLPRRDDYQERWDEFTIEAEEVLPNEKIMMSIQLPPVFTILFEPISHQALFLDVQGEPVKERRDLTVVYGEGGTMTRTEVMAPGPLRLTLVNRTNRRILPGLFRAGDTFHHQFKERQEFLTASRLFTNQTFRDLYRTEAVNVDQRLKIASLTVLFTDLKGSTELYERVGDLAAYDLVRAHFRVLADVVRGESGAVVKTIGDAVMATFPTAAMGVSAALKMRSAMDRLNESRKHEDLLVKIGMHEGPCLAVTSNDRLDYFGQTVNIAARVQGLATSRSIFVTEPVVTNAAVQGLLSAHALLPTTHRALLRGIADELTVYEIP
jgi:class 3 adenylate cyclase